MVGILSNEAKEEVRKEAREEVAKEMAEKAVIDEVIKDVLNRPTPTEKLAEGDLVNDNSILPNGVDNENIQIDSEPSTPLVLEPGDEEFESQGSSFIQESAVEGLDEKDGSEHLETDSELQRSLTDDHILAEGLTIPEDPEDAKELRKEFEAKERRSAYERIGEDGMEEELVIKDPVDVGDERGSAL
jgi:hypothetical protein